MTKLTRFGVSLEEDLLSQFDRLITSRGYKNRSEAIRDLIRESLVSEAVDKNKTVVATLSMIYDHHSPNLSDKLNEIQHHRTETSWPPRTFTWTQITAWKSSS